MLGRGTTRRQPSEAERPFWISYADLMTAMMVLFLVVMAATIIALMRKEVSKVTAAEERQREIQTICTHLAKEIEAINHVQVDCKDNRITFPDQEVGYFRNYEYRLPPNNHAVLGELVPAILKVADSDLGKKWLKRVIVEGYASRRGGYLLNLNLSMQRSYWVMCLLADPAMNESLRLTQAELQRVRELFRVGGASFNKPRDSEEMSRRVEFELEFFPLNIGEGAAEDNMSYGATSGSDACAIR
jgi:outer membrane protein OmpA-like peptidoglycan-associated protein